MNRTARILLLGTGITATALSLVDCGKDDNKNPLSTITTPTTPSGSSWNIKDIESIVSSTVTNGPVSVAVTGSYNPTTTKVYVNDIETSNYTTETIDQIYSIGMKLPVGKHVVKVDDTDDSKKEQRNVTVKPSCSKDVFNSVTDIRASTNAYKADIESTNAKAVNVNKALDMFNKAYSTLSPATKTTIDGVVNNTDVHIGKNKLNQIVFGSANVYFVDNFGRVIVADFSQTDVDAIRSKY